MCILHPMNSIREEVFSCELNTSRKVINLLKFAHALVESILEG